ncbi:unnamed protein product [Cylicocyclus nassatus]|uniref:Uncharacterized protein n=1 Tax=Cylicocyclus nassatus TaxID=53992 RepID=A0AA36M4T2_CYLNA|nr:unnamed protein product [Cylicocyclus nassatus]
MSSKWLLQVLVTLLLPALGYGRNNQKHKIGIWLKFMTLGPMIVNIITIVFILLTVHYIHQITKRCDSVVHSTHSLARCAVRLRVGPNARKSIKEYAKTKPELNRLLIEAPLHPSMEYI